MIIAMNPEYFNKDNLYLCKSIKNKIMENATFIRIIYSTISSSMNGVYISFSLNGQSTELYRGKSKFTFDNNNNNNNRKVIEIFKFIERDILETLNIPGKTVSYKLYEQLTTNNFKYFPLSDYSDRKTEIQYCNTSKKNNMKYKDKSYVLPDTFILKISGIWVTEKSYGITYKFSQTSNTLNYNT